MSLIPEFILQQVLVRGFSKFREDQRYIDTLFHNLAQSDINALRKFFREKSVDLCLNYPDQDLKLPSIVILLRNESESQAFLGQLMQDESNIQRMGHPFPEDELYGDATIVGRGSESPVSIGPTVQMIPTLVVEATSTTFRLPAGTFNIIDPFEEDVFVVVLEGIGAGQKRQIVNITPEPNSVLVDITPAWTTIPNNTSIVKIISLADPEGVTGEPSKLFTTDDSLERRGSLYKSSYQLLVLAQNQELTIFIYTAIKAMFVLGLDFMVKQGIMNFQMSGSDFAPRSEYIPAQAYQRALSIELEYSFDVIVPIEEPSARYLRVVVSTADENKLESVGLTSIIDLLP